MSARLIFERWCALHDSREYPDTRAFAKLLASAVADGEDPAAVECPYFISIAGEVRAEIAEIAERLRAHPDCDHRWWIYTDRVDVDGYEAPIVCSTCGTHPTEAEAAVWWETPRAKRWASETLAQLADLGEQERRAMRWRDRRETVARVSGWSFVAFAWLGPVVALIAS